MTTSKISFVPWELAPGGDRVSRWPQLIDAYSWDIEHFCQDYGDVLKLIEGLSTYEKQLIKHNLSKDARAKLEQLRSVWNQPIEIQPIRKNKVEKPRGKAKKQLCTTA